MSITYRPPTQAQLVRARRDALGLSKAELARQWGKSPRYVTGIENGTETVTKLDTAHSLARLLLITADDLYSADGRLAPDIVSWAAKRPKVVAALRTLMAKDADKHEHI